MAGSLREQLEANLDKITAIPTDGGGDDAPIVDAPVETAAAEPPSSRIVEAPKAKPAVADAGDGRLRDPETGKFVPKEDSPKADKVEVQTAAKIHKAPTAPQAPGSPQAQAALPQAAPKPRPPRPSSWKKEYWDKWDQLDPALAEYLHTRESQFASGVSAYKAEAEAAKPIMEAMQQFIPELQQHRINPTQWITELGHVHRMLALGTPQQKLQTLGNILRAYGIPPQVFSDQQAAQQYLQQGQFQQPIAPAQLPPAQKPLTMEEAKRLWQEQYVQTEADRELQRFAADTAKHPHYEELRETMSGLLQANLAVDLESAYDKALRMPEFEHLRQADLDRDRQAQEEARRAAEAQRVLKAKAKAVSPSSATPSGPATDDRPKGLRSSIESAFEAHAGGRV